MENWYFKNINKFIDNRGFLQALEYSNFFGEKFERFYFLKFSDQNIIRGYHAHKKLKQVIFLISGSVEVRIDDGEKISTIILNDYTKALVLNAPLWRVIKPLKKNSILGVLCNKLFDESDYIRDYDSFLSYVKCDMKNIK